MRKPLVDFIGIDVNKSATSWISRCLSEHPDICMSRPKETYFFAKHFNRGLAWYENCFSDCDGKRLRGEYTPAYMRLPEALPRIQEYAPEAKFIACLRKPADALASAYYFGRERGVNKGDIKQGILGHAHRVKYHEQLLPYVEAFGREHVLIVLHEDIRPDPAAFMKTIFAFLGVDADFVPPSASGKTNVTSGNMTRFLWVNRLLMGLRKKIKAIPGGTSFARMLNRVGVNALVKSVLKLNRRKKNGLPAVKDKSIPPEVRAALHAEIADDVRKLERLLGRDLSHWLS